MENGYRMIDANAMKEQISKEIHTYWTNGTGGYCLAEDAIPDIDNAPTVDAVEVVHGYEVGDVCFYGFHDGNKSLALVEIVKILSDERGVAEVKFLKVFVDNTGNGFFNYLLRSGNTMNASFKYLKNITPVGAKMDGGNEDG